MNQEQTWELIQSYFNNRSVSYQQTSSYDQFIFHIIPSIINSSGEIVSISGNVTHKFLFRNPICTPVQQTDPDGITGKKGTTPNICRLRDLTYQSLLYCDLHHTIIDDEEGTTTTNINRVLIAKLPVMLHSELCMLKHLSPKERVELGECENDYGGYFIVKGGEKVLVAQEKLGINQTFCFYNKLGYYYAEVRSSKLNTCRPGVQTIVKLIQNKKTLKSDIRITLPLSKKDIPIFIVFKAFGIITDKDMCDLILNHIHIEDQNIFDILSSCIDEAIFIKNEEMAKLYIAYHSLIPTNDKHSKLQASIKILHDELFPHLIGMSMDQKPKYIGYMSSKLLLTALGYRQEDSRDHFGNKRLEFADQLLGGLFRLSFIRLLKDFKSSADRKALTHKNINLVQDINNLIITKDIVHALATGNWATSKQKITRTGVSQVLSRLSYASTISYLKKVVAPIAKEGKLAGPRQLHNTSWGITCPADTPEGQGCGLIKNLSLFAHISLISDDIPIIYAIHQFIKNITIQPYKKTSVIVNGKIITISNHPIELIHYLRKLRRQGEFSHDICIHYNNISEINIFTDSGRGCHPLFVVENNIPIVVNHIQYLLNNKHIDWWQYLTQVGAIEWLDSLESENSMIAISLKDLENNGINSIYSYHYTHLEIHPSMILSICATTVPFPDHTPSSRNSFQSNQVKQAMGLYASNYDLRMDTLAHVLMYPQKPIIKSKASNLLNFDQQPSGCNAILAIMSFSGYNQEDSLIINKAAIERGMFRSIYFKTIQNEETKKAFGHVEEFSKPIPGKTSGIRRANFSKIDDNDGLPFVGMEYKDNDVIIGKTAPMQLDIQGGTIDSKTIQRDASIVIKHGEHGVVDRVMLTTNEEGNKMTKIRMHEIRIPIIGDKLSMRSSQKGTIGAIVSPEDMPYTKDGIVPDIIMNSCGIPSRMTCNNLMETVISKASIIAGKHFHATPFEDSQLEEAQQFLHDAGYQSFGKEKLYCGLTGKLMDAMIFIGPTYYQRLKHMVLDKVHSRARGPTQNLFRQPTEGRSRGGGLRIGEMENSTMVGHGAASLVKEKLFLVSDKFSIPICTQCGFAALFSSSKNIAICNNCHSTNIKEIMIPYASKVLFQELAAMQIGAIINIKQDGTIDYKPLKGTGIH